MMIAGKSPRPRKGQIGTKITEVENRKQMEVEVSKKMSLPTFGLFHFDLMNSANNTLYLITD